MNNNIRNVATWQTKYNTNIVREESSVNAKRDVKSLKRKQQLDIAQELIKLKTVKTGW